MRGASPSTSARTPRTMSLAREASLTASENARLREQCRGLVAAEGAAAAAAAREGELRSEGAEDRHVAETLLAVALERQLLLAEAKSSWQALASQGRILDLAAKRVASLERRALTEPRSRILLPLPFQMRLSVEPSDDQPEP